MFLPYEKQAKKEGKLRIAGTDEAGRGPLAGPVVAASCILDFEIVADESFFPHVNDSKKLSEKKRALVFQELIESPAVEYEIAVVDAARIDQINILQASLQAMQGALIKHKPSVDHVFVDGNHGFVLDNASVVPVVKGDSLVLSIACASVIAKVTRDMLMERYHEAYPEYGFLEHKGYPTKKHLAAIEKYGPTKIHRMTFAPLKNMVYTVVN